MCVFVTIFMTFCFDFFFYLCLSFFYLFFFSSRRRHTRSLCDWSSDVCSSDLVFIDWRHIGELLSAGSEVYSELKNIVVWAKTNAGQGSFYRSQHEFICVYKSGDAAHINNFELGDRKSVV